jgi:hypothetical protein
VLDWGLRLTTAAGLAVDAYVHAVLASTYDPIRATISEGDVFRAETVVSGLLALVVLFGRRITWAIAFVVAASAFGAVVLYGSVDVGSLGPLPDMYDPSWSANQIFSAAAEGYATVASIAGIIIVSRAKSRSGVKPISRVWPTRTHDPASSEASHRR